MVISPKFRNSSILPAPNLHPKSVAFIGASNDPRKWGFIVPANLTNGGFEDPPPSYLNLTGDF